MTQSPALLTKGIRKAQDIFTLLQLSSNCTTEVKHTHYYSPLLRILLIYFLLHLTLLAGLALDEIELPSVCSTLEYLIFIALVVTRNICAEH